MRKVSKVLLTIGGIVHIVNGASLLLASLILMVASIVFFVTGNLYGAEIVSSVSDAETLQLTMNILAGVYIGLSILFIGLGIVSFIASKITFRANETNEKNLLIAAIVFGIIIDVAVAVVGGIFGLIALTNSEDNKKPDDSQVATEVVK